jgi:hypothetical protein
MTDQERTPSRLPAQRSDDRPDGKILPFRPVQRPQQPQPPPDLPTDPPPAA